MCILLMSNKSFLPKHPDLEIVTPILNAETVHFSSIWKQRGKNDKKKHGNHLYL